ncbi:MAG: DUF1273 family protein [Ruminococcus sp.]|nr:DUF1273 family protein [Ruminococcus sp.]
MIDKSKTALFIGNRDCYQVKEAEIEKAIIEAIENGIEVFLNGGQGCFDKICAAIVHRLKKSYPNIKSILVIPYRDFKVFNDSLFDEKLYPFEEHTFSYYTYKSGSPKRNRWLVDHSSVAICYVYRAGGASKTLEYARKKQLHIIDCLNDTDEIEKEKSDRNGRKNFAEQSNKIMLKISNISV